MPQPLLDEMRSRIHRKNQHVVIIIVGSTGSGKSYGGGSLCEILDPEFTARRVAWSKEVFMSFINDPHIKRGNFIEADEAGVWICSRDSLTKDNKELMKVAETIRSRNLGIVFTVPNLGMVDKSIRETAHYLFITKKIDRVRKELIVKVYEMQTNTRTIPVKTYIKHPVISIDGRKVKIKTMRIPLPSEAFRIEYERGKQQFQERLYAQDESEKCVVSKENHKERTRIVDEALHIIRTNIDKYKSKWNGRTFIDKRLIKSYHPELPVRKVDDIKKLLEVELGQT